MNDCQKFGLPWVEKYRPMILDDIVSQKNNVEIIKNLMKKKCLTNMIFYGNPGTGKTSTIMAIANELYGEYVNFMVITMNASNDRGVNTIRKDVKRFASSGFLCCPENSDTYKLVILDEVDSMTSSAQTLLQKVIEECHSNVRFCLICNYIDKINDGLQSRCTKYRFLPISIDEIILKSKNVLKKEGIDYIEDDLRLIAQKSKGDMRYVMNSLQSIYMVNQKICNVSKFIGCPDKEDIDKVLSIATTGTIKQSYIELLKFIKERDICIEDIIVDVRRFMIDEIIEGRGNNDIVEELGIIISEGFDRNIDMVLIKFIGVVRSENI